MPDFKGWVSKRIRRKHSPRPPKATDKDANGSDPWRTVVNGFKLTLTGFKTLVGAAPVVGGPAVAVVDGLLWLMEVVEDVGGNSEDARAFEQRLKLLRTNIIEPCELVANDPSVPIPTDFLTRVKGFNGDIQNLAAKITRLKGQTLGARTANHEADKDLITTLNVELDRITNGFMLQELIAHGMAGEQLRRDLSGLSRQIEGLSLDVKDQRSDVKDAAIDALIDKLPRAKARYDSSLRGEAQGCMEGTRTELLGMLHRWTEGDPSYPEPIFWLSGEAGMGKSCIAHSIAKEQDDRKQLGASFFFSRNDADRANAELVFSTIAWQLASFSQSFKRELATVLKENPSVVDSNLANQRESLLVAPLTRCGLGPSTRIVIVVDALDECFSETGAEAVISGWIQCIQTIPLQIRLFVTSRPHPRIRTKVEGSPNICTIFHLHDVPKATVQGDIELYLRASLASVSRDYKLSAGWPEESDIQTLLRKIGSLFILASTYILYIKDPSIGAPGDQLESLRPFEEESQSLGVAPEAELDKLYLQIIEKIPEGTKESRAIDVYRRVMGAIVVAMTPLSLNIVSQLLDLPPKDIRYILRRLYSVVEVPSDTTPLTIFHASFPEFVVNPSRCDARFVIDVPQSHALLARACINILDSMIDDTFEDLDPSAYPGPIQKLNFDVPEQLQYASTSFGYHLAECPVGDIELQTAFENLWQKKIFKILLLTEVYDRWSLHGLTRGMTLFYEAQPTHSPELLEEISTLHDDLRPRIRPVLPFDLANDWSTLDIRYKLDDGTPVYEGSLDEEEEGIENDDEPFEGDPTPYLALLSRLEGRPISVSNFDDAEPNDRSTPEEAEQY